MGEIECKMYHASDKLFLNNNKLKILIWQQVYQ